MGTQEDGRFNERLDMEETPGVDDANDLKTVPPWSKQFTVRGIVAALVIGGAYSIVVMKMNLTTGLVPNLQLSVALLSFMLVGTWSKLLQQLGIITTPFTRQENTVIQTCAVSIYSIAVGGGFGSYMLGMNRKTYELTGPDTLANHAGSTKEPGIGWMTAFLFVSCFVGIVVLTPLRKLLILDYKLPYPTGTATAVMINGLFTRNADNTAKKQIRGFVKVFSFSFLWAFFQWFFAGGDNCGFIQFPTFGLEAWKKTFYFDFSTTYVGAGMIVSHVVNLSLLLGAIISYGIMWPQITGLKGDWYPADEPPSSMKSLNGYKVFVSIALILGDGMYNFLKVIYFAVREMRGRISKTSSDEQQLSLEEIQQNEVFMKESIPMWLSLVGYIILSIISIIVIPFMFPQLKWYYIAIAYVLSPSLCFSNAYGAGLTDMNMAYNYGKVALFVLAALQGREDGVMAGLAACGLIKSMVTVSADLMQDFKTGHLTLTSPRSMFISQVIGTTLGCIIAPLSFMLFYKAFDVGNTKGEYKAPYAVVYRNMAILGVEGFSALPDNCINLCYGFFAFAVLTNLVKDLSTKKIGEWVPIPMAMAVPFLVGGAFAIDMCLGGLVVLVWSKLNKKKADLMVPVVASGLMCGDGLWVLPASILSLARVHPPICMSFSAAS